MDIQSANATSSNGSSVAVWTEPGFATSRVMGQLFNSHGGKVGPVMYLAVGENFIAWQVQSGASAEVMAARYTASGNLLGQVVVANSAPMSNFPKIAIDTFNTRLRLSTRIIHRILPSSQSLLPTPLRIGAAVGSRASGSRPGAGQIFRVQCRRTTS